MDVRKKRNAVLRLLVVSVAFLLVFACSLATAFSSNISVLLNGSPIVFDQSPINDNGRILVPMRAIFEAMGATVDWNESTQTAIATKGNTVITMKIGNNILIKDGQGIYLDVAPKIVNGRTLVPARAVAESFGASVEWNGKTNSVIITASNVPPRPALSINKTILGYLGKTYAQLKQLCGGIDNNQLIYGGTPYTVFNNGVIAQYKDYSYDKVAEKFFKNNELPDELVSNWIFVPIDISFDKQVVTFDEIKSSFNGVTNLEKKAITDENDETEIYGYYYQAQFNYKDASVSEKTFKIIINFEAKNNGYEATGLSLIFAD